MKSTIPLKSNYLFPVSLLDRLMQLDVHVTSEIESTRPPPACFGANMIERAPCSHTMHDYKVSQDETFNTNVIKLKNRYSKEFIKSDTQSCFGMFDRRGKQSALRVLQINHACCPVNINYLIRENITENRLLLPPKVRVDLVRIN